MDHLDSDLEDNSKLGDCLGTSLSGALDCLTSDGTASELGLGDALLVATTDLPPGHPASGHPANLYLSTKAAPDPPKYRIPPPLLVGCAFWPRQFHGDPTPHFERPRPNVVRSRGPSHPQLASAPLVAPPVPWYSSRAVSPASTGKRLHSPSPETSDPTITEDHVPHCPISSGACATTQRG